VTDKSLSALLTWTLLTLGLGLNFLLCSLITDSRAATTVARHGYQQVQNTTIFSIAGYILIGIGCFLFIIYGVFYQRPDAG
jgi:hypothetical protein